MPADGQDAMWSQGWEQAVRFREALLDGFPLPTLPAVPVRLNAGEVAHAELVLDYSRFYGQNVTYSQSSGFYFGSPLFVAAGLAGQAIGNSVARSRAQAMAAPQWREFQRVTVYLTDQRLLALVDGVRWLSWYHSAMMQIQPFLGQWNVVQLFEDCEPLRWSGPAAPWLAVALVRLGYGLDHVRDLPEMNLLSRPVVGGSPDSGATGIADDLSHGGHTPLM
ncbi:hypothetical protein EV190_12737 [Actinorugispora endophytica]|uniref:Uncharacterized protein n=2 Tax=Actinorugispora endophytica TaxID=1605990 RepID=A0A4R6UGQ1_9ACTN|nr:hypothetical protein EV190_12737 [Actinorugispora endophytica]